MTGEGDCLARLVELLRDDLVPVRLYIEEPQRAGDPYARGDAAEGLQRVLCRLARVEAGEPPELPPPLYLVRKPDNDT